MNRPVNELIDRSDIAIAKFVRTVLLSTACLLLAAVQPSNANKVVRFLSPTGDTIWLKGNATGLTWDASTTLFLSPTAGGWLGYTFPDTANTPAGNYGFTTRDWSTQYQLNLDFSKGDTAWVFPDPFPSGSARVVYVHPRTKVVMFWNPWEYDTAGSPPRMQLESGSWNTMTRSGPYPGWYAYEARGFSAMTISFSDFATKKYVGAQWGLAAPFTIASTIVDASDTIWVRPSPEFTGGLVASAKRPGTKVIMLFNPWEGHLPTHHPRISFAGGNSLPMVPTGICGWYSFDFFERTPSVTFADDHGGQSFGAQGLGSATAIDVAATLASHDTAWIARDSSSGLAKSGSKFSGEKGHCEKVLLAATIRDFPSSAGNREFGRGHGCSRGGYGAVKGMVESYLDAERKPIRSAHDTGGIAHVQWWDEYAYRCTFDTTEPANLAEIGDSGISTNWFRTVAGKNAETCRDIPLVTDSVTGDYVYDNQQYFPIDDFKTLPDGSPNPYNVYQDGDGGKHNFGFCLESHGSFEYTKGQVFDFRGDDDVWFFIGGRLVVDLGGIHGPNADSVLLDSIGAIKAVVKDSNGQIVRTKSNQDSMRFTPTDTSLMPGRTYDFDFFFCERQPGGSSMRIRTDMNLRTLSSFQMRDTLRADGGRTYDLWVSRTTGQGCAARGEVVRTFADKIRLSGPSATPPIALVGGVHFGGISVAADLGSFRIDTAKLVGLAPGRYELVAVSPTDSTDVRKAVFFVPWTAIPRFVAKPPFMGSVGSSFPAEIAAFNEVGPDSSSVSFKVRPIKGLGWFFDSLLTSPVPTDSVLRTPVGHVPVRLWVRGDSAGKYTLVTGRSAVDSTDSWSGVEFVDKGLRFLDASGRPLPPGIPIVRDVGDTVRIRLEAFNGASTCTTCTDSLVINASFPGLAILDSTGKRGNGFRLVAGRGSFLVVGTAPADSASVSIASVEMGRSIARSPISFLARTLSWVDPSGQNLTSLPTDTSIRTIIGPIRLQARGIDGPCNSCTQWIRLSSTAPGILFLDSATGRPVDSLHLSSGRGSVLVTADRAVAGASLVAFSPSLDSAVLPKFTFRFLAPDSGAWYDDDGDGFADRAVVPLRLPWTTSTTLRLAWPDTTTMQAEIPPSLSISLDSLVATIHPTSPLPGTFTSMPAALGRWSPDGLTRVTFPMRDRIAPVATKARLRRGIRIDTLRIAPSEPISTLTQSSDLVEFSPAQPRHLGTPLAQSLDPSTGELILLYTKGTAPEPGDSVRFSKAGVSDRDGNRPGITSRKVVLQGTDRPPRDAVMQDRDGDGRADRVVLHFDSPPSKATGFRFRWSSVQASFEERLVGATPTISDSGGTILTFDVPPYALGATTCPASGCDDLGTMFALDDGLDTMSTSFPIRDGVEPVLLRARLRYSFLEGAPDTLRADFSEPLASTSASTWISWNTPQGTPVEISIPMQTSSLSPDGRSAVILVQVDSTFSPRVGDLARISSSGSLADFAGNRPGSTSHWTPIEIGARPVRFEFRLYPTMRRVGIGATPQQGEPSMKILLRAPTTGAWQAIDGSAPGDTSIYSGIMLSLNSPLNGFLFLYDNLGVYVGSIDLSPLASFVSSAQAVPFQDGKGLVHAWVVWNGTESSGRPVSDGVYTFRLVGYPQDGRHVMINKLYRTGRKWIP